MLETDEMVMHVQHRDAHRVHRQWLEDIARWREEHRQAAAMLKAVEMAWSQAQGALDEHAGRIKALEEHLTRHEQVFHDHGRMPDDAGPDPLLDEHREFDIGHAATRKAHEKMQDLYQGVMAEALELMKLTHPGAIVRETVA
jgi:hypothetical protein